MNQDASAGSQLSDLGDTALFYQQFPKLVKLEIQPTKTLRSHGDFALAYPSRLICPADVLTASDAARGIVDIAAFAAVDTRRESENAR
ncbi:hypothetical protein [Agrobacterium sp. T29]|uniref:hypothetical protein n=1 Tax=Agrobacterium sp. T29 TaxID=2580515 RepID=UPI00115EE74A|nr:hypothetical protein [Agrobacterium sp. T29]